MTHGFYIHLVGHGFFWVKHWWAVSGIHDFLFASCGAKPVLVGVRRYSHIHSFCNIFVSSWSIFHKLKVKKSTNNTWQPQICYDNIETILFLQISAKQQGISHSESDNKQYLLLVDILGLLLMENSLFLVTPNKCWEIKSWWSKIIFQIPLLLWKKNKMATFYTPLLKKD